MAGALRDCVGGGAETVVVVVVVAVAVVVWVVVLTVVVAVVCARVRVTVRVGVVECGVVAVGEAECGGEVSVDGEDELTSMSLLGGRGRLLAVGEWEGVVAVVVLIRILVVT